MDFSDLHEHMDDDQLLLAEWNDWPRVERMIADGIEEVLAHDASLIEDGTGERCVAHRLAVYLERAFEDWHIDCEFNRQGPVNERITKRVSASVELPESRPRQRTADVTPDIIVHRRRTGPNLLAIEVKPSTSKGLERDRAKLKAYLADGELRYMFAALVTYQDGGTTFAPIERVTL